MPTQTLLRPLRTLLPAFRCAGRTQRLKPSAIREILKVAASPESISLAGGLPAPELFPVAEVGEALAEVLALDGSAALQYGLSEGLPALREWLSAHLAQTVAVRVPPARLLLTCGSQQGLDLVARTLLDPGDVVLVENPAYLGALQVFAAAEADVRGLPADAEGILPEALDEACRTAPRLPKFLYLIPNFQNPTGTSTSARRRRQIAAVAREFRLPVVEDDPYGRLRYRGEDLPAVSSLPECGDWVYLGSTSKILAPGLRVGWLAASDRLLFERLVAVKQVTDLHTSSLAQHLVWRLLSRPGFLDNHLGRLRTAYARRCDALRMALARHLPSGSSWTDPDGGMFLWASLPERFDTAELLSAAARRQVAFIPGEPFWVGPPRHHTLRLNFSNASEERIAEGIRRLGLVLAEAA